MTTEEMEEISHFQINPTLSLYIPVVDSNINETTIKAIFEHENLGKISRIDFVYNNTGKKQAFIHFSEWFDNPKVVSFQEKILNSKEKVRLIYSHNPNKYWPIYQNKNPLAERPSHVNLIDILQNKIALLEMKLGEVSFQSSNEDEVPSKRPRNTLQSPTPSVTLSFPQMESAHSETFGTHH